jgi:hypothetical protein
MFWIIAVSAFVGMMVGAFIGVVLMSLMVMSSRSESLHMHDQM